MEFELEGTEQYALESYQWMLERILHGHGHHHHGGAGAAWSIRPDQTLFIISIRSSSLRRKRPVYDIAEMEAQEGGTFITIKDETYAPRLLSTLWRSYGRDRVQQLTRLEIFVEGVPMEELSDLKLDPEEEVRSQLLDAMWRLAARGSQGAQRILQRQRNDHRGTRSMA